MTTETANAVVPAPVEVVTGELVPTTVRAEMVRPDTDGWLAVCSGDLRGLAVDLCNSDFVPKGLRGNRGATLAAMLFGRELGLPPIASLQSLFSVDGRVGLYAQAMRALVLSRGHEYRIVSNDSSRCVLEGRRAGQDEWSRFSFTFQEAKDAGLVNKNNWKGYTPDMLLARATARMCRGIFPDVILGMATAEEIQDLATSTITVEQIDTSTGEITEAEKPRGVTRKTRTKKAAPAEPAGPEPERQRAPLPQPRGQQTSSPVENQATSGEAPTMLSDDDPAAEGQLQAIILHLQGRLKIEDRDDRLYWTAVAAEIPNPLDLNSSKDLTRGQAAHAINRISKIRNADGLETLLPEGAQAADRAQQQGGEQA